MRPDLLELLLEVAHLVRLPAGVGRLLGVAVGRLDVVAQQVQVRAPEVRLRQLRVLLAVAAGALEADDVVARGEALVDVAHVQVALAFPAPELLDVRRLVGAERDQTLDVRERRLPGLVRDALLDDVRDLGVLLHALVQHDARRELGVELEGSAGSRCARAPSSRASAAPTRAAPPPRGCWAAA